MSISFIEKLKQKWNEGKFVCVGLDPSEISPPSIFEFNKKIIDATCDLVCAYKINTAFYEEDPKSWQAMQETIFHIQRVNPEIPIILDAKRGDIGNTNKGYIEMAFSYMNADAITVHPYMGMEALQPFLDLKDKGIIVLIRTSNPGAGEFQDLPVRQAGLRNERPLYEIVAENVATKWNKNGNCAVVVGATYPEELKKVREIVGDMPILVPGIGAQGGDLEGVIKNGLDSNKQGLIISSSRAIIYADNPRKAVQDLDQQIKNIITK